MSSFDDVPAIELTDDRETVTEKIQQYAYSGGQSSVDAHRERGGDPDVDVAYQLLYYFFEPDDQVVKQRAEGYRSGELLSGELKQMAADRIASFLETHHRRRPAREELTDDLAPYRLSADERERAVESALN
jgi:tryptophanyl-tRNA synthetase